MRERQHCVYLAGPMSGFSEHNYPLFNKVARNLRKTGVFVCNPAELNPSDVSYGQALAVDLAWIISHAESVWFLPGWEQSKGCAVEHALAVALGLTIGYVATDAPGLLRDWSDE